jgi:hypothetical protein
MQCWSDRHILKFIVPALPDQREIAARPTGDAGGDNVERRRIPIGSER